MFMLAQCLSTKTQCSTPNHVAAGRNNVLLIYQKSKFFTNKEKRKIEAGKNERKETHTCTCIQRTYRITYALHMHTYTCLY